ncbi:MAG: Subtilisin [Candidatus Giovannonibacteria bacterium GW2011_GWA1_43_15]|uniref:Subtilisin n=1 Tax=Candidatus Giovannonibacteria bacterium GW2011_GWA2_44_26 TaxID=1618648 RepID=A0A0G1IT63_9BACT|nr:MAG: Subtilisin [Candidatus Giovannonibacteria bacterium GW2011_GWB1_43_13]KKS99016.1 MAG: Subtilisin [Candidatus Giovannonibacteria bacterium GW2011_GWA1_43_15]KKT20755.1 MAG: Subtilisin [Candidatus Giovannonibacteria bacterium GW2011_GWC2_43_8]KKT62108.1 MAG: Subtilisin [Candidatus Giovannonibacteria bacterium GW2011_GWA2_44_26]
MSVFALVSAVSARVTVDKEDSHKRVIAHNEEEESKALSSGCKVVREAKTLKALRCPQAVAASLSLAEDIKVFALDDEEVDILRSPRPSAASASANQQIGATIVHNNGNTGNGRKVVVLDTGYNRLHPELSSSYLGGKDFVNNDNDPTDDNGHGSHVAGIITADGIDPKAKGVAPDAGIIAGKVLDENGSGYFSDVVAAIYWAINGSDGIYGNGDDFGADAINLSLGTVRTYKGFCDSALPDLTNAISYAKNKGILVVVAAGNSGNAGVSIPGCISYSTTVGAVNSSDYVASFSGRGNALDITAPGVSIYSSVLLNVYATWSGTSMATPMISGVVALIKSAHPTYTQVQAENKLFTTAKDLGKFGKDKDYGWGRVRANLAVQ